MRRVGKLQRRQALHDARAVGSLERAYFHLPAFGDARAAGSCSGRERSQRAAGSPGGAVEQEARTGAGGLRVAMKKPIYLDYSATTPVDPRVADRMIPS